jgi:hypothetical protein
MRKKVLMEKLMKSKEWGLVPLLLTMKIF